MRPGDGVRPRPRVRFGAPLDFSRYAGMSGDRLVERSITDEVMYALMQLSGQEYVDVYAASVKARQGDIGFGARETRVRNKALASGERVPDQRAS